MPEQPYAFIISIFSPKFQLANDYQEFPVFTLTRVTNGYYFAFESACRMLLKTLSKGVTVKVGLTETSQTPRYIVFYASRENNQLTIYTRKTDDSPFVVLDPEQYREFFRCANAITFTKPVKSMRLPRSPVRNIFKTQTVADLKKLL